MQAGTSSLRAENPRTITNAPEMQRKMEELERENLRLKESLENNHTAMNEHLSVLVNRQDELARVYEAHRQKFAETRDRLKVVESENDELKARIATSEKDGADQSTQTEKTTDDPEPGSSAAAVDDALWTEMVAMAETCENQNKEIAHAHKIIASLKDQLESLFRNTFDPIKPEDLQSTGQIQEETHSQQFRDSFAHYNENLRELGYCYAAQTSRYTRIQHCLHRCSEILLKIESPTPSGESCVPLRSKMSEDLQDCRSELLDEESKTIAEREEMIRAQTEYQKIFIDYSSILFEVESLRREIERLNGALQSAVALRDERNNKAEAAAKEKERLLEEQRRGVEKDRQDLLARKAELQRSVEANASDLRKKQSLLEEKRKALDNDREVLVKDQEVLEKNREVLENDRKVFLSEKEKSAHSIRVSNMRSDERERSLDEKKERLEKEQNVFLSEKEKSEHSIRVSRMRLDEQERSLDEKKQRLEQERTKFLEQKRRFEESEEEYDGTFMRNSYGDFGYSDRNPMAPYCDNCEGHHY